VIAQPSERETLTEEKELLGLYLSGRPVDKVRGLLAQAGNTHEIAVIKSPDSGMSGKGVSVAGEIVSLRKLVTKNGDMMAVFHMEDWHDSAEGIDVVLFPRDWLKFGELIGEGNVVMVGGELDTSRGDPQIKAKTVTQNFNLMVPIDEAAFTPSAEPPAWLDAEAPFDEETGEVPRDLPPFDPDPPPVVVAPATQGAAAVKTPALEPQLVIVHSNPSPGEPAWMQADDVDTSDLELVGFDRPLPERWLMIYFQRSEDAEKDRRRLRRLHGILKTYPGKDRFSIVIEYQDQSFKMEFPNDTTSYCPELVSDLKALVGDLKNIEVFDRPQ
jgi:DNA polymerase III subunit alpha